MKRTVLVLWAAFLVMHGFYFVQAIRETPYQTCFPLAGFVFVQIFCLCGVVFLFLGRLFKGPRRYSALAWLLLAGLPVFIWYSQVTLAFQYMAASRDRTLRPTLYLLSAEPIGTALHEGIARFTAPNRLEGRRTVMRYGKLADPHRDLESMDAFVEHEETFLGRKMSRKLPWIRTAFFGQPGVAVRGYAYAKPTFLHYDDEKIDTEGFPRLRYVDLHEASHCIISIPGTPGFESSGPPMLFVEGWAQSRSVKKETLFQQCRNLRSNNETLPIEEMISNEYYNRPDDRIYTQGGALTAALLDEFGPEKFRELYLNTNRKNLAGDIKRVYGMTLHELDAFYWNKIDEALIRNFEAATARLTPEEKSLLEECREAVERQTSASWELLNHAHIETETVNRWSGGNEEPATVETKTEIRTRGTMRIDCRETSSGGRSVVYDGILLPEAMYSYNEIRFDDEPEASIDAAAYRKRGDNHERRLLHDLRPETIFTGSSEEISDYLWKPPASTVIEIVRADDSKVVISAAAHGGNPKTMLTFDRSRDWLLVHATLLQSLPNGEQYEEAETRHYAGTLDGVALLKKRTYLRRHGSAAAPKTFTSEVVITKMDARPDFPAAIFDKESLPLHESLTLAPLPPDPMDSLYRHWTVIGLWLLAAGMLFRRQASQDRKKAIAREKTKIAMEQTDHAIAIE